MQSSTVTYRVAISNTLKDLLRNDERVVLLGESIADPYGGACKVTRGLTRLAPDRVIDTPICEGGMMGIATGLALRGFIPVLEIMFADFLTLCVDQIYNVAMKVHKHQPVKIILRVMQNDHDKLYGPTHSQDMRWLLDAIPGLKWRDLDNLNVDMKQVYRDALDCPDPVVVLLEYKRMYSENLVCTND
jgi:pyruvate/2-oxoglutarate/acetoin dehydrogenase E1 component